MCVIWNYSRGLVGLLTFGFSFDWFSGSVTGATFFRGSTHGYWANQFGLSTEIVMLADRTVPSRVGGKRVSAACFSFSVFTQTLLHVPTNNLQELP
jgi:hypothetical protein